MKALSIRQPWAWLIIRPDVVDPAERQKMALDGLFKDIENRTWSTNYRGRIAIHASKKPDPDIDLIRREFATIGIDIPHDLDYGQIVGTVVLVDCTENDGSEWAEPGMVHWILQAPQPIEPVAYKGRLGLWDAPL